jgi:RNA polymerase sigma factor FliA
MSASGHTPQQLIENHQGLVRSLAVGIRRRLPPSIDMDDLIAYGQVGLAEAARDFDPERGMQFSTFAYYRIRGAMYDSLSKMTWFSRAQHRQVRCEQMSDAVLQEDEKECGDTQGDVDHQLRWLRDASRRLAVVHLATRAEGEAAAGPDAIADASTPSPPAAALRRELHQVLEEAVGRLPSHAAALIRAVYFEGQTLQEAGQRLGISKSWASRLHAKTLLQLARFLQQEGWDDASITSGGA